VDDSTRAAELSNRQMAGEMLGMEWLGRTLPPKVFDEVSRTAVTSISCLLGPATNTNGYMKDKGTARTGARYPNNRNPQISEQPASEEPDFESHS